MNGWTEGKRAVERGEYVIRVGGSNRLATWNPTHGRWFDGYQQVQPEFVSGFLRLPEFPEAAQFARIGEVEHDQG